ncbi:MAG: hypothetical protein ACK5HT_18765 [Draconibacterium sp.]
MKRFDKMLKYAAAAIFFVALVANVSGTLNGFSIISAAVAQGTGTSGSGTGYDDGTGGGNSWKTNLIAKCKWRTVTFKVGADGKIIEGSIKWTSHKCSNCAKTCDATASGACTQDELCPTGDTLPNGTNTTF